MRLNTIINRYIVLEMLPPFGINLLFFSFIFLVTNLLEITNMVVNYQVNLGSFLLLLLYNMPFFLAFITPMSVMMAVLLTFLKMSSDNEIVALKASGMTPHRLLIPVFLFCLLGWLLTTLITMVALPWGNRSYSDLANELAKTHIDAVIKERTFIDNFNGLMLYVSKINLPDRSLTDVFIEDQRNATMDIVIVAPSGRLMSDPNQQNIRLRLFNGSINQVDLEAQTTSKIDFKDYEIRLDLKQAKTKNPGQRSSIEKMTLSELRQFIDEADKTKKSYFKAQMKYQEKFALPVACFALGFLAIPLGMHSKRSKRSTGTVLGILLFLVYYIMLSVGWSVGESGTMPPIAGMWAPNILMSAIAIYMYARMLKDRPMSFAPMSAILEWLRKAIRRSPVNDQGT